MRLGQRDDDRACGSARPWCGATGFSSALSPLAPRRLVPVQDIDALLAEADDQLGRVREMYADSLRSQAIPSNLPPKIKNILENQ
jgi:hypothetical protein